MQVSAKVHRCSMTAVGTGRATQAALADLAAVDCKTGASSCYSSELLKLLSFVPVLLSDQDLSDSTLLALVLHSPQYSAWLCESLSCL